MPSACFRSLCDMSGERRADDALTENRVSSCDTGIRTHDGEPATNFLLIHHRVRYQGTDHAREHCCSK